MHHQDCAMLADLITPTVSVELLGSTPRYAVYRVVFATAFARDVPDQQRYQAHIDALLEHATQAHRRVWLAIDPSRLRPMDNLRLLYRFALPNLKKPVTVRVYNVESSQGFEPDVELGAMLRLVGAVQHFTPGSSFQAALPPGFVPRESGMASDVQPTIPPRL
jgi:hypothetical protein